MSAGDGRAWESQAVGNVTLERDDMTSSSTPPCSSPVLSTWRQQ
jgi:hypothetical protein